MAQNISAFAVVPKHCQLSFTNRHLSYSCIPCLLYTWYLRTQKTWMVDHHTQNNARDTSPASKVAICTIIQVVF